MATLKNFILIIIMCAFFENANAQDSKSDTSPVKYIVWDISKDTLHPVLLQKKGFIVFYHNSENIIPLYFNHDILDEKKRIETLTIVSYKILY